MKVLMLALCGLAVAGCTNAPNAIRMAVLPCKPIFAPGEPVHACATLVAVAGPVCLGTTGRFDVEVWRDDWEEPHRSRPHFYCGTGYYMTLPLYPILTAIALVDVADTMNRYTVLWKDQERSHRFAVLPEESLPPGRYHMRVTLPIRWVGGSFYPGIRHLCSGRCTISQL